MTDAAEQGGGWQLGIGGAEVAWDELSDLLAARGAEVDNDPDEALLVATFEGEPDLMIIDALGAWLENLGVAEAEIFTRCDPSAPWQASWRAVLTATRVSERLWLRPAWEAAEAGRTDIVIDPTTAFGGGFHPTTAACLRLLDRALARMSEAGVAEPSVMDVGSGTGILAIAAALLGARATGVEIDGAACQAAARNARLNGVEGRVQIFHDTLQREQRPLDLVLANVVATVLIALAPAIQDATGRAVILSGIQENKEATVRAAYAGLELVERVADRGWVTLWLAR